MTPELLSAAEIAVHRGREGVLYQLNVSPWTIYKLSSSGGLEAVGAGEGLPAGGTTGQVLAKASGDDGDAEWVNAGAGDLLAANNLSDVASAATARENLGLEIGVDVQAYSANLAEYAAVNPTAAGLALLDDADGAAQLATMAGAAATGSGGVVRATSPTLVTPALGTPSSGNLSSCTAFPATALTAPTPVTLSGATNLDAATHGGRLLILSTNDNHVILDDTAGAWAAGAVIYGKHAGTGAATFANDTTGATNTVTAGAGKSLTGYPGQEFSFTRDGANAWTGGFDAPDVMALTVSDETTALTTGTAKVTFRFPYAGRLVGVRASLTTASSSGTPTFDINEAGTTMLSTKLTVDASETTSTTAAAAAVISDATFANDAQGTVDIDTAGTGAAGAKLFLYMVQTA